MVDHSFRLFIYDFIPCLHDDLWVSQWRINLVQPLICHLSICMSLNLINFMYVCQQTCSTKQTLNNFDTLQLQFIRNYRFQTISGKYTCTENLMVVMQQNHVPKAMYISWQTWLNCSWSTVVIKMFPKFARLPVSRCQVQEYGATTDW